MSGFSWFKYGLNIKHGLNIAAVANFRLPRV